METFAFGVRLSLDGIVKVIKNLDGDAVCIFVIVTEERGTVQYELFHGFLSFEVGIGSMDDLLHIEFTFFEYMFFQNGEAVGNSTQTGALNIACVITRSAVIIIFSFGDTVINEQRQESGGSVFGEHTVNVVADAYFHIYKIMDLFKKCVIKFFITPEGAGISCYQAYFLA